MEIDDMAGMAGVKVEVVFAFICPATKWRRLSSAKDAAVEGLIASD